MDTVTGVTIRAVVTDAVVDVPIVNADHARVAIDARVVNGMKDGNGAMGAANEHHHQEAEGKTSHRRSPCRRIVNQALITTPPNR